MKQPKYRNHKADFQGLRFDSELERDRYIFLLSKQREGMITNLRRQVPVLLIPKVMKEETVRLKTKTKTVSRVAQREVRYVADFVYDLPSGHTVYEDTKSRITLMNKEFILKRKMLLAFHGIELHIVLKSTGLLGREMEP